MAKKTTAATKSTKGKSVATIDSATGNVRSLPARTNPSAVAAGIDYSDDQTSGLEGLDRAAFLIPRIVILQKLSPQLDKGDEAYIKGADDGDILNSATLEVYGGEDGIDVLPVLVKHSFVAWTIREKGGGLKGEHPVNDPIITTTKRDEKNRELLPDGETQLVDTLTMGVILLTEDGPQAALIAFTSTQLKKARRWNTQMAEMHTKDHLPLYAHKWHLSTTRESNDKGNWAGWVIEHMGLNDEYAAKETAHGFKKALQLGELKLRADPNAQSEMTGEDIPF